MKDFFWLFLFVFFLQEYSFAVQLIVCVAVAGVLVCKRKGSLVLLLAVLMIRLVCQCDFPEVELLKGKVVQLFEQSFLMQTSYGDVLVVTEDKPMLDAVVEVKGDFRQVDASPHFFESESRADVLVYPETITIVEQKNTLRYWVQHKILELEDVHDQSMMMKVLLRCSSNDVDGYLSTIQLSFVLYFFSFLLRPFFNETAVNWIKIMLVILLSTLWNCHWTGFRILYFKGVKKTKLTFYESLGLYCVFMFLIDPKYTFSSSFWFSLLIRLSLKSFEHHRLAVIWTLIMAQMCFRASFDIVEICCMPVIQILSMISTMLCFLRMFVSFSLTHWSTWLQTFDSVIPVVELHGSISLMGILMLLYLISSQKKQWILSVCSIVVCFLCSFRLYPRVIFFNVGQGDSILIHSPLENRTVLIDTGPPSSYLQLRNSLYAQSVYKLDLLILSHNDADHSGNLEALKKDFRVKEVWDNTMNKSSFDSLSMLQLNEISDEFNDNDRSLILAFAMNEISFLFSGDASSLIEEKAAEVLSETIDVCKIAHHGSKTSTSSKFLDQVGCRLAIISAGVSNRYGHPHKEVIERLEINGSTILNTQIHGDIQIVMTRFFNLITTSNHEFGIIGK